MVDHEARRAEIADAVWRVIRRDGVPGASVRTVAAEAGWSTGAIRHYFASQAELLRFTAEVVTGRAGARLRERGAVVPLNAARAQQIPALVDFLAEVLPVDADHRAECEAWVALVQASRTDPTLGDQMAEGHRELREVCESVVRLLLGESASAPEVTREADLLHALLDGFALHGVLHPRVTTPRRIRAALAEHLSALGARDQPNRMAASS